MQLRRKFYIRRAGPADIEGREKDAAAPQVLHQPGPLCVPAPAMPMQQLAEVSAAGELRACKAGPHALSAQEGGMSPAGQIRIGPVYPACRMP